MKESKERLFIFYRNDALDPNSPTVIIGYVFSKHYPSSLVNDPFSKFHGAKCSEIAETCSVRIS